MTYDTQNAIIRQFENRAIKMAKNTNNNRIPVKWIRDKAKAAYEKQEFCFICNTTHDLELHHLSSITLLLEKWTSEQGLTIETDEDILAVRDDFIAQHHKEIYEDVYTLCNKHHVALHGVYGKSPALNSADKQRKWIEIQKSRLENGEAKIERPTSSLATFARFY